MLMDKPMFNLEKDDRKAVIQFLQQLKKQGLTLIMVTQFPSLLEDLIDETIIMEMVSHSLVGDSMKLKVPTPEQLKQFEERRDNEF